jgi:hypothetical protein
MISFIFPTKGASCKTQQNLHPGDIRGTEDLEKPGFRLRGMTLKDFCKRLKGLLFFRRQLGQEKRY